MNKIIEDLAGQAFQYAADNADETGKGQLGVFAEKFAELMIIEFSDVVKQTANDITTAGFTGDGTPDEVMLCVNGALTVLDNIRKRFGVEK